MRKPQLEMLNCTYGREHSEAWHKLNIDQDLATGSLNLEPLPKPPGLDQSIWLCFVFPRRASGTLLFFSPFFHVGNSPRNMSSATFGAYLFIFLKKAS